MENVSASLDSAFRALADPTRRAVVSRLLDGPAPVKDLARPFEMGLPSFMKHLQVLEDSGLIRSEKIGRVRTCHACPESLAAAENWLAEQRLLWEARTDRMVEFIETELARSPDNDGR